MRLPALDVLRGIAILGTLGTNVWIFMYPGGLLQYMLAGWGGAADADWTVLALQQLTQGKFLGLLAILFGMGIAIQQRAALAGGRRWPGSYPLRAAVLFLDGLLHYLFVVEFDVLMGYALTSIVVAGILCCGARGRLAWMVSAALAHLALLTLAVLGTLFAGGQAADASVQTATAGWWDMVHLRIEHVVLFRIEMLFIGALSVALFLAGASLLQAGIFEARGARLRRTLMLLGLGLAWPLDMASGVLGGEAGLLAARYGTAPIVALGLLALVAECFVRWPRPGFAGRRLAEVGRMALSCYVLQNLVASVLCYDWGLGLARHVAGDWRTAVTIAVYLLVGACVLGFAHLWLGRFARGPLEWAWNALYRRLAGARHGTGATPGGG